MTDPREYISYVENEPIWDEDHEDHEDYMKYVSKIFLTGIFGAEIFDTRTIYRSQRQR